MFTKKSLPTDVAGRLVVSTQLGPQSAAPITQNSTLIQTQSQSLFLAPNASARTSSSFLVRRNSVVPNMAPSMAQDNENEPEANKIRRFSCM